MVEEVVIPDLEGVLRVQDKLSQTSDLTSLDRLAMVVRSESGGKGTRKVSSSQIQTSPVTSPKSRRTRHLYGANHVRHLPASAVSNLSSHSRFHPDKDDHSDGSIPASDLRPSQNSASSVSVSPFGSSLKAFR